MEWLDSSSGPNDSKFASISRCTTRFPILGKDDWRLDLTAPLCRILL